MGLCFCFPNATGPALSYTSAQNSGLDRSTEYITFKRGLGHFIIVSRLWNLSQTMRCTGRKGPGMSSGQTCQTSLDFGAMKLDSNQICTPRIYFLVSHVPPYGWGDFWDSSPLTDMQI